MPLNDIENKIENLIFAICVEGTINTKALAKQILSLIREVGWKGPEEVKQFIRQMCDTCLSEPERGSHD